MSGKMVAQSTIGLDDVKDATSGASNSVDQLRRDAYEPLSHLEGLLELLDGDEGGAIEKRLHLQLQGKGRAVLVGKDK